MIPYGQHCITKDDIEAVVCVLRDQALTQGTQVPAFEKLISEKVQAKRAVATNSATSALHIACLAVGLGPGDVAWTSPITFVASANCALYCGAQIDFVDIERDTGLMDMRKLREKLEIAALTGGLPKVVIPVHLAGASCDMEELGRLSSHYGFTVIEDASHAIGGKYKGSPVGNCRYSSISVFSFHPVKIITTGEGGLATTNDDDLWRKMVDLRSHGIIKDRDRLEERPKGPWTYEQQLLGFNYRMTDIAAAIGASQAKRLEEIVDKRNEILQNYERMLDGVPLKLLKISHAVRSSVHLAVIQLERSNPSMHRSLFCTLLEHGIGTQLHYSPVHLNPYYKRLGFKAADFPTAEGYAQRALSIPIYPELTFAEQEYVISTIKKWAMDNWHMQSA